MISKPIETQDIVMTALSPETFHEAVDAWLNYCRRIGKSPQQPSLEHSSIDYFGIVTLRNADGFIARYSSRRKRLLTNV
jgi:hypothetical protein